MNNFLLDILDMFDKFNYHAFFVFHNNPDLSIYLGVIYFLFIFCLMLYAVSLHNKNWASSLIILVLLILGATGRGLYHYKDWKHDIKVAQYYIDYYKNETQNGNPIILNTKKELNECLSQFYSLNNLKLNASSEEQFKTFSEQHCHK